MHRQNQLQNSRQPLAAVRAARRLLAPIFVAVVADSSLVRIHSATTATILRVSTVPRALFTFAVRPSAHIQVFSSQSSVPHTDSLRLLPPVLHTDPTSPEPRQHPARQFRHFRLPRIPHRFAAEPVRKPREDPPQSPTPPVPVSRHIPPPEVSSLASHQSFQLPHTPSHAFLHELHIVQAALPSQVTSMCAPEEHASAPLLVSPPEVPPPAH